MLTIPSEIFGVETYLVEAGIIALYIALGCWLIGQWARHDEPPPRPWKWGDPIRRAKQSFEERLFAHLGGLVTFGAIVTLGTKQAGIW